eukprot:gene14066-15533_t
MPPHTYILKHLEALSSEEKERPDSFHCVPVLLDKIIYCFTGWEVQAQEVLFVYPCFPYLSYAISPVVYNYPYLFRKSEMINVKPLHTSWRKKLQKRTEEKNLKKFERELKQEARKQKEEKRQQLEERQRRREENRKKSEIVQQITNTSKLKRLKKKQLRKIEKR